MDAGSIGPDGSGTSDGTQSDVGVDKPDAGEDAAPDEDSGEDAGKNLPTRAGPGVSCGGVCSWHGADRCMQ